MSTIADQRSARTDADLGDDSPAPAIVYATVGIGLVVCLTALLLSSGSFSIGRVALALLLAVPFLLYARLAVARPGADAVVAGVLLIAVGTWGSVVAMGDGSTGDFTMLAISLVVVQLVVFAVGALLRAVVPAPRD